MCSLPPVLPGPFGCLAMVSKWTFSAAEGRCAPYSYGGCRGTANLFNTEAECEAKCPAKSDGDVDAKVCSLKVDRGRCRGRKVSNREEEVELTDGFFFLYGIP